MPEDDLDTSTTSTLGELSGDEYLRSSYSLDISVIATPIRQLRLLKPGTATRAKDSEIHQWDRDYNTGPYALIGESRENIEGWASWGRYYESFREYSFKKIPILSTDTHINEVMRHLRKYHGALIASPGTDNQRQLVSVIFPLYLNRYQVRSFFYYWILGLETRIIKYVSLLYPTDSEFQKRLTSIIPREREELNRILRSRRNAGQVRARLAECIYMWHGLRILNGDPTLEKIRWLVEEPFDVDDQDVDSFSAQDIKNATIRDLVDFRNSIMHPMSDIVTNDDLSVAELVKKYVLVKKMAQIMDAKIRLFNRS